MSCDSKTYKQTNSAVGGLTGACSCVQLCVKVFLATVLRCDQLSMQVFGCDHHPTTEIDKRITEAQKAWYRCGVGSGYDYDAERYT